MTTYFKKLGGLAFYKVLIILFFLLKISLSLNDYNTNLNVVQSDGMSKKIRPHKIYQFLNKHTHKSCDIDLFISNCSPREENKPKFSKYRYIIFLGSISLHNCELISKGLEKVQMNWEIWKLEESETKVKDIIDKTECLIEEDSLDYGTYKLKLATNIFFHQSMMKSQTSECYFEVVGIGSQTIIYGGLLRTMDYRFDINFDVITMLAPGRHAPSKTAQVTYRWACQSVEEFCIYYYSTETHRLIKDPFTNLHKIKYLPLFYFFELNTKVKELQSSGTKITTVQTEEQYLSIMWYPDLNIGISCLLNCGGSTFRTNPQEIVHLEVKYEKAILKTFGKETKFVWHYKMGPENWDHSDETEVPIEARSKDFETNNSELRIKRDFLEEDKEYLFTAVLKDGGRKKQREGRYATGIKIFTSPIPTDIKCTLNPSKYAIGKLDVYDILCTHKVKKIEVVSVMYEFHNKIASSDKGRHLGFSLDGMVKSILITRPQLHVSLINMFGGSNTTQIKYPFLYQSQFNKRFEVDLKNKIDFAFEFRGHFLYNYIYRINLISAYCDYLSTSNTTSAEFKFNQINSMLEKLSSENIPVISGVIMVHSVMNFIIEIINSTEPKRYLKSESIFFIGNLMNNVSVIVRDYITNPKKTSRLITIHRTRNIADEILHGCNLVLVITHNYNLQDLNDRKNLKNGIRSMVQALMNILNALEYQQMCAVNELYIETKNIWLKLVRWEQEEKKLFKINTDENILDLKPSPKLHLNIINFKINPFWWSNGYKINTHVKMVELPVHLLSIQNIQIYNELREKRFKFELKINYFNYLKVSGKVKQPNPDNSVEINDMVIAVHRIESEANSLSFINFTYIQNNTSLRVVILQGKRPDFDLINNSNNSKIVTQFTVIEFLMQYGRKDEFFYIGILPGRDVKTAQAVEYNFTTFTAACRIWKYDMWIASGRCRLEMTSSKSELQCLCQIKSKIIAGYVHVPSHLFNPFSDFPLLILDNDYPLIVLVLIVIYLLYFILLVFVRKKDKTDEQDLNVTVLDDNDPQDSAAYLVGVFTGARLGAGTTSNIGIRLFGDLGFSRSHILNSLLCPSLNTNSDNWFLLFAPHHLGTLTNILLWSDHSGTRPNWYCSKIIVYDLMTYEHDFFFVESWFGMTAQGICLKLFEECATYMETNKVSRIISENLLYGFLETHYWLSIFCKHPRSPVTRTHRLTTVVCGLLVNVLVVCFMLYFSSSLYSVDLTSYNATKDTLIIGIVGSLSGYFVTFIIMHYLYNCYMATENPMNVRTNKDCYDPYHKRRKITESANLPKWVNNLQDYISQHIRLVMALPLQSTQYIIGFKIDKERIKVLIIIYVVILVSCAHFIVALGFQYGEKKMLIVCSSIIVSVVLTNLVIMPIKIFTTAVLLGCTRTRFYELLTFSIALLKIVHNLRLKYSKSYKRYLIRLRKLEMYNTPTKLKMMILHRKNQKYIISLQFYYIIGCVSFLSVIIWHIEMFKIGLYFLLNVETFCTTFGSRDECETVYRNDLENVMEFWDSLANKILPALYSKEWYNGQINSLPQEIFHETGWLINGASRLIGVPRLRQIRVSPKSSLQCRVPDIMKNFTKECHLPTSQLSEETEDKNNYGIGWGGRNNTWFRGLFDSSPWEYTQPSEGMGTYMRGPSGQLYHSGGYIAYLHRDLATTEASLSNLFDKNWIDSNSRVIIADFTMYNVNKDVFTETYIVVEVLTVGSARVIFYFKSFQSSSFITAGVLFGFMVVVFSIQVMCVMNITGTKTFLISFWNIYDCVLLVMFVYALAFYCSWTLRLTGGREELTKQGKDVYFSLDRITGFKNRIKNMIGVMFALLIVRLLRIVRFNDDIRAYTHDLMKARTEIFFACLVSLMFMYIQFRFIMFLAVAPSAHRLKDVLILNSRFQNLVQNTYRNSYLGKVLVYLLNFTSQLGIFSFMLSEYHHYKKAQEIREKNLRRKEKFRESLLVRIYD